MESTTLTGSPRTKASLAERIVDELLVARGITERDIFLSPDYDRDMHDPFLMLGMERAVERIFRAMKDGEHIVIYSDYDTDGIPGGVILHDLFQKIGYTNVGNYIPHRHDEGYGLNHDAIESFKKNGTTLMITVDCGIADVDEVARAQEMGIDVILTDHHLPQETLPPAYVILNSKQSDDPYPEKMLAGAGVAFKLACAILARGRQEGTIDVPEGWEKWLLDMAGVATVADMVPLVGENRTLAYYGLKVLQKSRRPGLRKLLSLLRIPQAHITEDDIGFMIGPRINAASRMDDPMKAFRMLATTDDVAAHDLAKELNAINDTRKTLVAQMMKEANKKLHKDMTRDLIVIGNPNWRPGVLGLVANRLMEEYKCPVFVWGRSDADHIKGSCRSDGTINVVELMSKVRDGVFLDIGGHELSGGFSVSHDAIHFLEDELRVAYAASDKNSPKADVRRADATITFDDVTWSLYDAIARLAPFGVGNAKPVFSFDEVVIREVKHFGKEKNHLELGFINSRSTKISAIGFFTKADSFEHELNEGDRITLHATLEKSMFRGRPELRLRIVDVLHS